MIPPIDPYADLRAGALRAPMLSPDDYGAASGVVLRSGWVGADLPFYGAVVGHVCATDASAELLRLARSRIAGVPVPVSLVSGSTKQVPFANAVFDTIVTT